MSVSANRRSSELWRGEEEAESPEVRFRPQLQISVRSRRSLETALAAVEEERGRPVREIGDAREEAEACHTPTSEEHRLPEIGKCPPAPRKPRPEPLVLKRKLSELRSISVDPDEIESFFRADLVGFGCRICRKIKKCRVSEKE